MLINIITRDKETIKLSNDDIEVDNNDKISNIGEETDNINDNSYNDKVDNSADVNNNGDDTDTKGDHQLLQFVRSRYSNQFIICLSTHPMICLNYPLLSVMVYHQLFSLKPILLLTVDLSIS